MLIHRLSHIMSNIYMYNGISVSFLLVAGTPSNFKVTRTGYSVLELSWTAPGNTTPPIAGYEVFLVVRGSQNSMSVTNTTETSTRLSEGISLGDMYSFFVVAYSDAMNTLPSPRSETQMVEISEQNRYRSLCRVCVESLHHCLNFVFHIDKGYWIEIKN